MQLRDYQQQTVDVLYDYLHYNREGAPIAVLPTGAGKSICIASFIHKVIDNYSEAQFLVLSHVKEILEQNYQKVVDNLNVSAGIYCAGLGKKEINNQVTFASLQSLYNLIKRDDKLNKINIVIIDECHLVNSAEDSMYRKIFKQLLQINPKTRFVGFTATPYRAKEGLLTLGDDRIFTDIAIDIPILPLIEQGYLSKLSTKISHTQANLDGVCTKMGDYIMDQAEEAMTRDGLTDAIIENLIINGKGRKRWLLFCCNVKHAEEVQEKLSSYLDNTTFLEGYPGADILSFAVTGETNPQDREDIINLYRQDINKVMAITNCNVLTTGFDAPNIDLVAFLRPTQSLSLYIQMLGRGMRISPTKNDCLILDYAGNVQRFGPINFIDYKNLIKKRKGKQKKEYAKQCPQCEEALKISAKQCHECGYVYPKYEVNNTDSLDLAPTNAKIIGDGDAFWFTVKEVNYYRHAKPGKTPSLCVSYSNGIMQYKEWVCIEHKGFARGRAIGWWAERWNNPHEFVPDYIEQALDTVDYLDKPKEIKVKRDGKYWKITDYNFGEDSYAITCD